MKQSTTDRLGPMAAGALAFVLLIGWHASASAVDAGTILEEPLHYRRGMCVHLGTGNGDTSLALSRDGKVLVRRLDPDADRVAKLRRRFLAQSVYGQVSVEHWPGKSLPYVDHLVGLIVVDGSIDVPESEILRVLSPLGTAFVWNDGSYKRIDKPWPKGMSEWNHPISARFPASQGTDDIFLNAPNGLQWIAGTPFIGTSRSKRRALVSARGRVFCVTNNSYRRNTLVQKKVGIGREANYIEARNAFNGSLLWTRAFSGHGNESSLSMAGGKTSVAFNEIGPGLYDRGRGVSYIIFNSCGSADMAWGISTLITWNRNARMKRHKGVLVPIPIIRAYTYSPVRSETK